MRIKLLTLELLTNLTTCVIYNYLYTIMEYNNTKYKVNITLLQGLSLSPHLRAWVRYEYDNWFIAHIRRS